MKNIWKVTAGLFAASMAAACTVDFNQVDANDVSGYYFTGYVYDGVTAQPIENYNISITYMPSINEDTAGGGAGNGAPVTLQGSVAGDGRYSFSAPLKPGSDFTVSIDGGNGYRPFLAHETQRNNYPSSTFDQQSTLFYEAYLFPTNVESPEVTLEFFSENVNVGRPNGQLRLAPANGNATSDLQAGLQIPWSVNGQNWFNDLDARHATKVFAIEDGAVTIEAGDLVYGVTYTGTIYSVDGHQYETFNFTAGVSGNQSIVLQEFDDSALFLVNSSNENGQPAENGRLVITLSRAVEFSPRFTEGFLAEALDDGFSIDSPDFDTDGDVNVLLTATTDEPEDQENGTRIAIDGNVVTLSWANDADNFDAQDDDDPILSVTWGNLFDIAVVPVGEENAETTLGDLLGSGAVTVQLVPTPAQ